MLGFLTKFSQIRCLLIEFISKDAHIRLSQHNFASVLSFLNQDINFFRLTPQFADLTPNFVLLTLQRCFTTVGFNQQVLNRKFRSTLNEFSRQSKCLFLLLIHLWRRFLLKINSHLNTCFGRILYLFFLVLNLGIIFQVITGYY